MDYRNLLWIIFGGVLINTWRNIITFYWRMNGQHSKDKYKRDLAHAASCG